MSSPSRLRSARTLAAVTAVAVAASGAVVLAPSAQAFYGSESTVRGAVLTTSKIASTTGWTGPLSGSLTQQGSLDWLNEVTAPGLTDAQVAPDSSELVVADSTKARDESFAAYKSSLTGL